LPSYSHERARPEVGDGGVVCLEASGGAGIQPDPDREGRCRKSGHLGVHLPHTPPRSGRRQLRRRPVVKGAAAGMHILLGGTGQVGSAVARALLRRGEAVTILTREEARGAELKAAGAQIAVSDVRDTARLRDVFRAGRRAFLLNPSAAPSGDTDVEERLNVASILNALEDSRLELVVAASTYGARPGERCGDLTVLYELEEGLRSRA